MRTKRMKLSKKRRKKVKKNNFVKHEIKNVFKMLNRLNKPSEIENRIYILYSFTSAT